jgi:hypothetical protein
MKILFAHYKAYYNHRPVETYSTCMVRELRALGHDVMETGKERFDDLNKYKRFDLLMDVDSGRNSKGQYEWHMTTGPVPIPSVAYFIDTHGKADLHAKVANRADHVFFAPWVKRDVFAGHESAHWSPCATDLTFFNRDFLAKEPQYDFGFFGSKGGLDRAAPMQLIADKQGWTTHVAQVAGQYKHQWPRTAEVMGNCKVLWNHGQKHDDPNQRVMESMAIGRVLITPYDIQSGMGHLFEPWQDYIPYEPYTCKDLDKRMKFAMTRPEACAKIAENAHKKVVANHTIKQRIAKVLEVVNA